jgi:hypothetical protein
LFSWKSETAPSLDYTVGVEDQSIVRGEVNSLVAEVRLIEDADGVARAPCRCFR